MNTSLQDAGLLLLRVVPSGIMMTHGWPKFQRLLDQWGSEDGVKFFDFMGLGPEISLILTVLAELVAPALLVVGLQTRLAAIPAAFTMGVAAFVVHGSDPLGDKELALLYLVCFAALLPPSQRSGRKWSVQHDSARRRSNRLTLTHTTGRAMRFSPTSPTSIWKTGATSRHDLHF